MIAVDTNLLVYAHREESEWHRKARALLVDLASGGDVWAIPWSCVHEFLAVVTHPRIYDPPTPRALAFDAIRAWARSPGLQFLGEGPGYLERLEALCRGAKIAGARVHDARVAAICLHHGVSELWSADRDFSSFPGIRVRNPLVEE